MLRENTVSEFDLHQEQELVSFSIASGPALRPTQPPIQK